MRLLQIDAFTNVPFKGNPAAVCISEKSLSESWMQAMAMEMNLSETAFLWSENSHFRLRWFTPTIEIKLCGHATLASAHAIWTLGLRKTSEILKFNTLSGELTAEQKTDGIELVFPEDIPVAEAVPTGILDALGIKKFVSSYKGRTKWLIELETEDEVRNVRPDFGKIPHANVIVTAQGQAYDFVSRCFAPASGIPEDPVTGSAHCLLTPFWSAKLGKKEFRAYQASKRGGELITIWESPKVKLRGQAVTIFETRVNL